MNLQNIEKKFEQMGARVKIRTQLESRQRIWPVNGFSVDVQEDKRGAYFDLYTPQHLELDILDVQRNLRHLLLMVRQEGRKDKFLCGHDERHWFTCAVPGNSVSNVKTAIEALKPTAIQRAQSVLGLSHKQRLRRHNRAYRRQGEWFFLPEPKLVVDPKLIFHNEPISRGRGKAHWCQELFRTGGETVYVSHKFPTGLDVAQYRRLIDADPKAAKLNWRTMKRDAGVYVRGDVSHPDHATITLHDWCQVLMNTESQAPAARNVVFLD